jgi:hypothetical protein
MLVFVPVMFFITLAMTILSFTSAVDEELAIETSLARDFEMVHSHRAEIAERDSLVSGTISDVPGYPFKEFYGYDTEVIEDTHYIIVVSWPTSTDGSVTLPQPDDRDYLASISSRNDNTFYKGNFQVNEDGTGASMAGFDLSGLSSPPVDGTPMLLKIFNRPSP